MADQATKDAVKRRVLGVVAWFAAKDPDELKPSDDLRIDYGLGALHIRALAKPISHIIQDFDNNNAGVTQKEMLDCQTLADVITLAQGKLP